MPDSIREHSDTPGAVEPAPFAFSSSRASVRLVLIFGLSRGLGLLRETGIAAFFGTGTGADRLAAAFVISSFAVTAVSEASGAAAIRRLSADPSSGASLLRAAKRWSPAAMLAFVAIGAPLAALLTAGEGGEWWVSPVLVLALTPCVATSMQAAVGGAQLTLEGRIGRVTASQACWSGGALLGIAAVAAGWDSPLPVALGWAAGNVVGYFVVRSGVELSGPRLDIGLRRLLGPSLAVAGAYSLLAGQGITDRLVATRLETGAIAALGYADRLYLVPVGFILAVYGPAVLGDLMNLRKDVSLAASQSALHLRRLVRGAAPCALAGLAFAPLILRLVLGHGEFDEQSQTLTLGALDGLLCGVVATSFSLALLRVIQALGSVRRLPLVTGVSVTVNLVVSLALSFPFGVAGIALGTSLTAMVAAILQLNMLERFLGRDWLFVVLRSCLLPAAVVLVTGTAVTVLAYEGVIDEGGRIGICLTGALVLAGSFWVSPSRLPSDAA